MSEKYEVEYRALIPGPVFSSLFEKGKEQRSATFNGPVIIHDAYFCRENVRDFKEIEMDTIGSYSLRLRQEEKDGKMEISMNTKTIKNVGDHNAWAEHEISVSSYAECSEIIRTIGFKKFFELTKKRYSFLDEGVTVCLEDIKDFGQAVEIEILTTKENAEESKMNILAYLQRNGVTKDMVVEKSITNLLMKKLSKF